MFGCHFPDPSRCSSGSIRMDVSIQMLFGSRLCAYAWPRGERNAKRLRHRSYRRNSQLRRPSSQSLPGWRVSLVRSPKREKISDDLSVCAAPIIIDVLRSSEHSKCTCAVLAPASAALVLKAVPFSVLRYAVIWRHYSYLRSCRKIELPLWGVRCFLLSFKSMCRASVAFTIAAVPSHRVHPQASALAWHDDYRSGEHTHIPAGNGVRNGSCLHDDGRHFAQAWAVNPPFRSTSTGVIT